MRALITGSEGFVGKYLRSELEQSGYDVIGVDIVDSIHSMRCDLRNPCSVEKIIEEINPDVIFHLAAQANVKRSWDDPIMTFDLNVDVTINILEALRKCKPDTKVLLVGSSDEYGNLGNEGAKISENIVAVPSTPYAVSKLAQENIAKVYVRAYGMNIVMTRSFNHCGIGQKRGFLIPDFAYEIVKVERGLQNSIKVGNLEARRDFTHVKDVTRAYRLLAEKGVSGEIYNVGSGITYSAKDVLEYMIKESGRDILVEIDENKIRPIDTPVICCDSSKLKQQTGWEPTISMLEAIREQLEYQRVIFE